MTISMTDVVNDPDLAQPFSILRSVGQWINGIWKSTTTQLDGYGVVAEPTTRDLKMVPEGDIVQGMVVFWSVAPLYATHATEQVGSSSDILLHRGLQYRVLQVEQYQDYGYYRALATRMKMN